jgi:lauroyl/myristoyl acyltransferase
VRGKPLLFRLYGWLGRDLGHEGLQRVVENFRRATGSLRTDLPLSSAILERILGRSPRPEETLAMAEERLSVQADLETTLYLLDEDSAAVQNRRLELPALAAIKKARAAGKGVILASPHFGNYPLLLLGLGLSGVPLHVMFINSSSYGWVERFGVKAVPLGGGGLDYTRALAEGGTVFIFADMDFFPGGKLSPFFGAPIRPPHGLARLSEATGAPVLPLYALRSGSKWRVEADSLIPSGPAESVEDTLLRSMERRISAKPGHWVMFHDLWDVEAMDRKNRRQLKLMKLIDDLRG